MVIGVVGFWENKSWVYSTPDAVKDRIRLWNFTMKAFGVSKLVLVDVDDSNPEYNDAEITLEVQKSLEAVLDAHSGRVVFLSQPALIPPGISCTALRDFVHPADDVLYVVGSDYGQLDFEALLQGGYLQGNRVVSIETQTSVPLWSHVALALALYDRYMKQG